VARSPQNHLFLLAINERTCIDMGCSLPTWLEGSGLLFTLQIGFGGFGTSLHTVPFHHYGMAEYMHRVPHSFDMEPTYTQRMFYTLDQ